jgi:thiamine biosynthesis protein ThiS
MSEITISVNGERRKVADGISALALLRDANLEPKMILVELNETALQRHEIPLTIIKDGDRIEFIRIVAGG